MLLSLSDPDINDTRRTDFRCSVVIVLALGYEPDDRASRVQFPAGLGIFLFATASRTALGPTQPPIQWVLGTPSLG
jgi:hypothetical protein